MAPDPHDLTRTIAILWVVEGGGSAADYARLIKINPSNAFRSFQSRQRSGLLAPGVKSIPRIWALTPAGKTMLQHVRKGFGYRTIADLLGGDWTARKHFRWHHVLIVFPRLDGVEAGPLLLSKGFASGSHGRIGGFVSRVKGWRVFVSGKSVMMTCPKTGVYSGSPHGAVMAGLETACEIAEGLMRVLPWLKLGSRFEVCRQELAEFGVTPAWVPEGYKFEGDVLKVDFSLGVAEAETFRRDYAFDDMNRLARYWDSVARG